jgi:hypothetical protein
MSQEKIELLRGVTEAFTGRDLYAFGLRRAPNVERYPRADNDVSPPVRAQRRTRLG